jgi:YtcA family
MIEVVSKVKSKFGEQWGSIACRLGFFASLLSGCARAPSFNIMGSFFPSWLICTIVAIIVASLVRLVLVKYSLEHVIRWPVLVYPCLALALALTFWLILFS